MRFFKRKLSYIFILLILLCSFSESFATESSSKNNKEGTILFGQGKIKEASEKFSLALSKNPDNVGAMGNLAFALNLLGRHSEALDHINSALTYKPREISHIKQKAQTLAALSRHKEALKILDEALLANDDYEVVTIRAKSLFKLEKYPDVLELLGRPFPGVPRQALSLIEFYRALSLTQLNRNLLALRSINKSISLFPDNPKYYLVKAMLHERLGELELAHQSATQAEILNSQVGRTRIIPIK